MVQFLAFNKTRLSNELAKEQNTRLLTTEEELRVGRQRKRDTCVSSGSLVFVHCDAQVVGP